MFVPACLALVLLILTLDAEAGRRGIRVEFGAWSAAESLDFPPCLGSSETSTEFDWQSFTFSGSRNSIYLADKYCQISYSGSIGQDPTTYLNESIFPLEESGIAQKIGSNDNPWPGSSVFARRYTYLDRNRFSTTPPPKGYQWAMYFFRPSEVTLVTLHGAIPVGTDFFDPLIHDWNINDSIWSGQDSGYDGEYWCFIDDTFVGMWDGDPAGSDPLSGCQISSQCYELTLSHEGSGSNPAVVPTKSTGCPAGSYRAGEFINVTANAASGWELQSLSDADTGNRPGEADEWDGLISTGWGFVMPARNKALLARYRYVGAPRCPSGWTEQTLFQDDMEGGVGAWSSFADVGSLTWALETTDANSPTHAWHGSAPATTGDQSLVSPSITLPPSASRNHLLFYSKTDFPLYDGAALQISTDNGSTWEWVESWRVLTNSYNASSHESYVLGDRPVWSGQQDWTETTVDLVGWEGKTLNVRFRIGTNFDQGGDGWFVDDVRVTGCVAGSANADLQVNTAGAAGVSMVSSTGHTGSSNYSVTVSRGETVSLEAPSNSSDRRFTHWIGCNSSSGRNCTVMPLEDSTVEAVYVPMCLDLTVGHTGSGSDPATSPAGSFGCSAGQFDAGDLVKLSAGPSTGWAVSSWNGTANDNSPNSSNQLIMPSTGHHSSVAYQEFGTCPDGWVPRTWLDEDMEDGASGWTSTDWLLDSYSAYSPENSWSAFTPGNGLPVVQRLESPAAAIPVPTSLQALRFFNYQDLREGAYCEDAALLEYSLNDGLYWLPIFSSDISINSHNNITDPDSENPFAGLNAWCNYQDWSEILIDLSRLKPQGKSIRFRFNLGSYGTSEEDGGYWYVDDVEVFGCLATQILVDGFESR